MFDWLEGTSGDALPTLEVVLVRLGLAFALGCMVAGVYALTQRRTYAEKISFATTLVLLTLLIAMVTLIIGNNVARAFSLAGALAIIRFRTVVEDTRDTAFVIFAVVVGMGMGSGMPLVPLVGTPMVAGAAFMLSSVARAEDKAAVTHSLEVRLARDRDPNEVLGELLEDYASIVQFHASTTARQGAVLDVIYHLQLRPEKNVVALMAALNRIEGIQGIELRRI